MLSNLTTIYGLVDPRTEEIRYVGLTKNLCRRTAEHLNYGSRGRSYRASWLRQLERVGVSPSVRILDIVVAAKAAEVEIWWIANLKAKGASLTNLTEGGDGAKGAKRSEEMRRKLSEFRKTFRYSEASCAKISASRKLACANPTSTMLEGWRKTTQAHLGSRHSDATRARMREAWQKRRERVELLRSSVME